MALKNKIQDMPKIELHCHLDGSIRPETIRKLAQLNNIPCPSDDQALKQLLVAPENTQSLMEYLEKFEFPLELLQTAESLTIAAEDIIYQASLDNVKYIEVRFAPSLHTRKGLEFSEIIRAVLKGLQLGKEKYGVESNALLCGMRHEELEEVEKIVHLAKEFLNQGVASFDLAGNEVDFPPHLFSEILQLAQYLEVPITLHAGECGCAQNVYDAVELGATRIGHGVALIKDMEHCDQLRKKNITLEMAPTSNLQTKASDNTANYPFDDFLKANLKVTINTDNRTVSNTNLNEEYAKLIDWFGYEDKSIFETCNLNAVDGAFISDEQKEELRKAIKAGFARL